MRVVVCTIVHHPADARIYHRQIRALLEAEHEVTYIAPVGPQDFNPERTWPSLQLRPVPGRLEGAGPGRYSPPVRPWPGTPTVPTCCSSTIPNCCWRCPPGAGARR